MRLKAARRSLPRLLISLGLAASCSGDAGRRVPSAEVPAPVTVNTVTPEHVPLREPTQAAPPSRDPQVAVAPTPPASAPAAALPPPTPSLATPPPVLPTPDPAQPRGSLSVASLPGASAAQGPIVISAPVSLRCGGVDVIVTNRPGAGGSSPTSAPSGGGSSSERAGHEGEPEVLTLANTAPAYARVTPQLSQLPPRVGMGIPRFPPKTLVAAALSALRYIDAAKMTPQYESLAKIGLFEMRHLTSLRDLAQAAWHVRAQVDAAQRAPTPAASPPEAKVPLALLDTATKTRGRMMRVLEFHFLEDPVVAEKLTYLRGGMGIQDLASDLVAMAKLYQQYQPTLAGTPKLYQPSDATTAQQLAEQIQASVNEQASVPSNASEWQEQLARVTDLLAESYDEVRRTGLYLLHSDPTSAERFPSLAQISRRGAALATRRTPAPTSYNP